jgi:hypothetical protein
MLDELTHGLDPIPLHLSVSLQSGKALTAPRVVDDLVVPLVPIQEGNGLDNVIFTADAIVLSYSIPPTTPTVDATS